MKQVISFVFCLAVSHVAARRLVRENKDETKVGAERDSNFTNYMHRNDLDGSDKQIIKSKRNRPINPDVQNNRGNLAEYLSFNTHSVQRNPVRLLIAIVKAIPPETLDYGTLNKRFFAVWQASEDFQCSESEQVDRSIPPSEEVRSSNSDESNSGSSNKQSGEDVSSGKQSSSSEQSGSKKCNSDGEDDNSRNKREQDPAKEFTSEQMKVPEIPIPTEDPTVPKINCQISFFQCPIRKMQQKNQQLYVKYRTLLNDFERHVYPSPTKTECYPKWKEMVADPGNFDEEQYDAARGESHGAENQNQSSILSVWLALFIANYFAL